MKLLKQAAASRGSAFIPIYGRRRVGKSALILQSLKGKPGIYFLGKKGPAGLQRREFLQVAAGTLQEPLLAQLPAEDWRQVLAAVLDRWDGPEKLILAFDEFQWTAEASPELPSILQELWDRRWQQRGDVLLILCGSYLGFMEREVLGKQSPLFGRRTAQILLRPFAYREAALFHPDYSLVDQARTYFICGGIPLYLRYFSADCSLEQNIAANLLDEYAPLYREPDFLLREELREVENYYAILMAIASGYTIHHQIARQAGMDERRLHYYLQHLMELGYLRRRYPLTGSKPVLRHVRYSLEDPLLRFWFRFIYPNTSSITQMGAERWLATRVRPELDAYFGDGFERLCREAMPVLYEREGVTSAFEVGEYWDKSIQIDVIGYRGDGWTDVGECKWGTVRSWQQLSAELEEKVQRYPNPRNATIGRRLFARTSKPSRAAIQRNCQWHDLEDLYGTKGR